MKTKSSIQKTSFVPNYWSKTIFRRDDNLYTKQPTLVEEKRLPKRVVIEPTQRADLRRNGAIYVLHDGRKDGEHQFFTGLVPIDSSLFFGNHFINAKRNLLIFKFSDDFLEMSVYYFHGFYIDDRPQRIAFIIDFLNQV